MEQLIGLAVVAVFAFIMWIIHENAQAALIDPTNTKAIYLDQLPSVSELRGRGQWLVTIIRQSGNFHSSKDVFGDASQALAAAITTFRRAKIDGIGIIKNGPEELHFSRLFHNHRGSNEGKKVGQAIIKLLQPESPPSRPTKVSGLTLTMKCDCGTDTSFTIEQIEGDLVCAGCRTTKHLDAEKIASIKRTVDESLLEAQARIDAGEEAVDILKDVPSTPSAEPTR